jgi:hypothetical protein
MNKKLIIEASGWVGMAFVQGATVPPSIRAVMGDASGLPPLSFVLMIWVGLAFYLVRAVLQADRVYIVSNLIGFTLNSVLLALIVYPWG